MRKEWDQQILSGCSSSGPAALALGQEELPEDPQGWHGGAAGLPGAGLCLGCPICGAEPSVPPGAAVPFRGTGAVVAVPRALQQPAPDTALGPAQHEKLGWAGQRAGRWAEGRKVGVPPQQKGIPQPLSDTPSASPLIQTLHPCGATCTHPSNL